MGALRLHPARVAGLSPRAVSRAWSVFDVQLAIYALALVVIGLLMAFTNSGDAPLSTGSVFTRALMWLAIAIIVFAWPVIRDLYSFDQRSQSAELPMVIPQVMVPIGLSIMAFLVVVRLLTGGHRIPSDHSGH